MLLLVNVVLSFSSFYSLSFCLSGFSSFLFFSFLLSLFSFLLSFFLSVFLLLILFIFIFLIFTLFIIFFKAKLFFDPVNRQNFQTKLEAEQPNASVNDHNYYFFYEIHQLLIMIEVSMFEKEEQIQDDKAPTVHDVGHEHNL